jgi:hypothetical protein
MSAQTIDEKNKIFKDKYFIEVTDELTEEYADKLISYGNIAFYPYYVTDDTEKINPFMGIEYSLVLLFLLNMTNLFPLKK